MKCFIGYFDFLGYKSFVEKNETEYTKQRVGNILMDIEACLGRGKYQEEKQGAYAADLSNYTIKFLNISDTVIFWTQDGSAESIEEFLDVCYRFNTSQNGFNFPVRGTLIYDEMEIIIGNQFNEVGGTYSANMIYGKGLIKAHIKTGSQNWAGCTIDNSVVEQLVKIGSIATLNHIAVKYMVPYKCSTTDQQEEYVLRLAKDTLNTEHYENYKRNIVEVFKKDNKEMNDKAEEKLNNTIKFLDVFRE